MGVKVLTILIFAKHFDNFQGWWLGKWYFRCKNAEKSSIDGANSHL
jgi:hypothetical protein